MDLDVVANPANKNRNILPDFFYEIRIKLPLKKRLVIYDNLISNPGIQDILNKRIPVGFRQVTAVNKRMAQMSQKNIGGCIPEVFF